MNASDRFMNGFTGVNERTHCAVNLAASQVIEVGLIFVFFSYYESHVRIAAGVRSCWEKTERSRRNDQ